MAHVSTIVFLPWMLMERRVASCLLIACRKVKMRLFL